MTDIRRYIENTLASYRKHKQSHELSMHEKYRHLGVLEAALIFVGVLKAGEPFVYGEREEIKSNWLFVLRGKRQETYSELIERLAQEWLDKQKGDGNGTR